MKWLLQCTMEQTVSKSLDESPKLSSKVTWKRRHVGGARFLPLVEMLRDFRY